MQDYTYLRVTVVIWAVVVNTQTHTDGDIRTDRQRAFERLFIHYKLSQIS